MSEVEELDEELAAIEAIYPNHVNRINDTRVAISVPQHDDVSIQMTFPTAYPAQEPPNILEVSVTNERARCYDKKYLKSLFEEVMGSVYHQGSVCVFDFLTELDGILYVEEQAIEDKEPENNEDQTELHLDPFAGWIQSEPVTDRASTFIAFAAHVNSEEEAFKKLDLLKTDRRIMKATHVMAAWRIQGSGGITYQDSDDDGETAAGGRMLHLLTIMDAWNVIVAVSRWFGGIRLGPDRFKHINSTTREAIVRGGFVNESKSGGSSAVKQGKKK
ncbi:Yih1p Ecym_2091 [Eremothecium cymbalariae DBVPG|uniref:RWD domain-containing protein n=1 Tax=Eremothecium cymbalariae (strain CBS 270.75 / DBVPG 7215 / KCTC 17166 / NRRL Y-17582) TaxID=931890 RepID=G8JPJ5_ERECY|nr:Hypothetical protein Ecym_2091 [Eremothecium cymbalariae DBVPG\